MATDNWRPAPSRAANINSLHGKVSLAVCVGSRLELYCGDFSNWHAIAALTPFFLLFEVCLIVYFFCFFSWRRNYFKTFDVEYSKLLFLIRPYIDWYPSWSSFASKSTIKTSNYAYVYLPVHERGNALYIYHAKKEKNQQKNGNSKPEKVKNKWFISSSYLVSHYGHVLFLCQIL